MRWCWSEMETGMKAPQVQEFCTSDPREFEGLAIAAAVRARGMTYRPEERLYPRLELSARHPGTGLIYRAGVLPSRTANRNGLPIYVSAMQDGDEMIILDHAQEWWGAAEAELGRREPLHDVLWGPV